MPYGTVKVWLWPTGNGITHTITWKSYDKKEWKDFLEMLKASISASNRMYDPQTKLWQLDNKVIPGFKQIVDKIVQRVYDYDPNAGSSFRDHSGAPKIDPNNFFYNTTPAPQAQTRESVTESLAKILGVPTSTLTQPIDVVKKLYRRKALELHPDRNNGDGSKMSELNSLWSVFNG